MDIMTIMGIMAMINMIDIMDMIDMHVPQSILGHHVRHEHVGALAQLMCSIF